MQILLVVLVHFLCNVVAAESNNLTQKCNYYVVSKVFSTIFGAKLATDTRSNVFCVFSVSGADVEVFFDRQKSTVYYNNISIWIGGNDNAAGGMIVLRKGDFFHGFKGL